MLGLPPPPKAFKSTAHWDGSKAFVERVPGCKLPPLRLVNPKPLPLTMPTTFWAVPAPGA